MSIFVAIAAALCLVTAPIFYDMNRPRNVTRCTFRNSSLELVAITKPIVFIIIPDIFLLLNLLIVFKFLQRHRLLLASSHNGPALSESRVIDQNSQRKQRQLTIMLVAVSLSFYLFTTPAAIQFFHKRKYPAPRGNIERTKMKFLVGQICVILIQFSNAVSLTQYYLVHLFTIQLFQTNFIFYSLTGERFRRETKFVLKEWYRTLVLFYHRCILRNSEYRLAPIVDRSTSQTVSTFISHRGSCSPNPNILRDRKAMN